MTRIDWKGTVELVGIAAIVASLVFVGFQLKQDRDVAIAESSQSSEASVAEINALIADHANVWLKGRNDQELTESENVIMNRIVDSLHRRARYTAQMRRKLGLPGIAALRDLAITLYENPGARRVWDDLTDQEASYFEHMNPEDDFRGRYRNEILLELAKLDGLSD